MVKTRVKTAVLWGDWKYTAVGITPEEAQFLDTRKYARTQIAALIGVPPHKIGDTTRLSNSNHEQEELQFVTDTLRPEINNAQMECKRKLFPPVGRNSGRYEMGFDLRERLRADFKTTHEALALGRQWSFYTANKCLEELGDNPIGPEGDVLLYPINMGNAKALLDPAALHPSGASKPAAPVNPEAPALPAPKNERAALPAEITAPATAEERMALAQCRYSLHPHLFRRHRQDQCTSGEGQRFRCGCVRTPRSAASSTRSSHKPKRDSAWPTAGMGRLAKRSLPTT